MNQYQEAFLAEEDKSSQKRDIWKYIQKNGSITPLDALREFRCMRLSARISELIKEGKPITGKIEVGLDAEGKKCRYSRYSLAS